MNLPVISLTAIKGCLVTICLIFLTYYSLANNFEKIDSLEKIVNGNKWNSLADTSKLKTLNSLSKLYFNVSADKSIQIADKAIKLANNTNNYNELGSAILNKGKAYYYQNDFDESMKQFEKALKIYQKLNDKKNISVSLILIGVIYKNLGDYEKALVYYNRAFNILQELGDKLTATDCLNNIGNAYFSLGQYNKALKYQRKALKFSHEAGDTNYVGKSLFYIGTCYSALGIFDEAINYYLNSIKILQNEEDEYFLANAYNHLGVVYQNSDQDNKAKNYYLKTLKIYTTLEHKFGIASSLHAIGSLCTKQENYNEALEYYQKSFNLFKETGNKEAIIVSLRRLGNIYLKLEEYDQAFEYLEESLRLGMEIGNKYNNSSCLQKIGETYHNIGNYNKALEYYNSSQEIAIEIKAKVLISNNYKLLSETYLIIENFEQAFINYKLFSEYKDSIFSEESSQKIAVLQMKFKTAEKERENELLKKNNDIQALKLDQAQNLRNFIIIILILVIVLVIVILNRYYIKTKANKQLANKNDQIERINNELQKLNNELEIRVKERTIVLKEEIEERKMVEQELIIAREKAEESDKLKTHFLANMSHEIRTPMNSILGFSQLLSDPDITDEIKQKYINRIKNNGNILLSLITDILDVAKIEAKQINIVKSACEINLIQDDLFDLYNEKIKESRKNIELKLVKGIEDTNVTLITDEIRFTQILSNLLDNAVKYTYSGHIEFGYKIKDNDFLEFYVKDTGIGIPKNKIKTIFERFRQVDDSLTKKYGGAGLGLTIVESLVNFLEGKIRVDSTLDKGSTFYFTLPHKVETHLKVPAEKEIFFKEKFRWNEKVILIVEDVDSNYELLKAILKRTKVTIIRAIDGKEAIEICRTNTNIDLVLMDIQIPIINGYDVTKQIKKFRNDLPVISQTAYATEEERENSNKAGCDDYIIKPINSNELFNKIDKLLVV